MAWNPSPKVAEARDFGEKFDKKMVIILSIDKYNDLEYASYGKTKGLCGIAKNIADVAYDAIMDYFKDK